MGVAWVLAALLGVASAGWTCPGSLEAVPIRLRGLWRTNASAYQDRSLHISARSLSFGTGGKDETTFGILGVESAPGAYRETRYVVHLIDAEGERDEVVLFYRDETPLPSLRLANQRAVWRPHARRPGDAP